MMSGQHHCLHSDAADAADADDSAAAAAAAAVDCDYTHSCLN